MDMFILIVKIKFFYVWGNTFVLLLSHTDGIIHVTEWTNLITTQNKELKLYTRFTIQTLTAIF